MTDLRWRAEETLRQAAPALVTLVICAVAAAAAVVGGPVIAIGILAVCALTVIVSSKYSATNVVLFFAWGAATFTAEAAFGNQSNDPAALLAFTPTKLVPLVLLGAVAIVILFAQKSVVPGTWAIRWWYIFFGWMLFASLFSGYTRVGVLRILQGLGPLLVVAIARRSGRTGPWLLFAALGACAAHVAYGVAYGQHVGNGTEERLIGLVIANAFGFAAGMTVLAGVGLYLRFGRIWGLSWLALSALGLDALVATKGRTAALALPIALLAMMFRRRGGRTLNRLVLGLVLAASGYYIYSKAALLNETFTAGGNTDIGTLSGRTTLWHELLSRTFSTHPIVGWGPGTFRVGGSALTQGLGALGTLGQAHNSLIEAIVAGVTAAMVVFAVTIGNLAGFGMAWYVFVAVLALPPAKQRTPVPEPEETVALPEPTRGAPRRKTQLVRS